jgi:GNAT superfamily N-acetyltransferase
MDQTAVLAAFDEQLRRNPQPDTADTAVERSAGLVRTVSGSGWNGVTWSDLDAGDVDTVIADQVRRFGELARPWEWKHYSYDRPADLPARLVAAGLARQPAETLLVAEIADLALDGPAPEGVELRAVEDERSARALVRVHDEVFGGDHAHIGRIVLAALARDPRPAEAVVAYAGAAPISAARVEFHQGTDFASLWGGGTLPGWRRRGVFRALVAHRARQAASRGFRYLQVDASPDSRPILGRLGFVELATTTPFIHPGPATA